MIKDNLVAILIIARFVTFTMMYIGYQAEDYLMTILGFVSSVILIFVPKVTEVSFYTFVSVAMIVYFISRFEYNLDNSSNFRLILSILLIYACSQYIYLSHIGNIYRVNDVNNYPLVRREMIVNELNEDYKQIQTKKGKKLQIQVYLEPKLICYVRDKNTNELKRVVLGKRDRVNFDPNYPKNAQPYLELRKVHLVDINYGIILPAQIEQYEYVIRINKAYLVGNPRLYQKWQITDKVNEVEPIV